MAERLGEGYIEIFGMDARFNESLRQVQRNMAATTKMVAAGQRAMGLGPNAPIPARDALGRFTAGAGVPRGPAMHPFFPGRDIKGRFVGQGGGADEAKGQIEGVSGAYKALMGLYAVKVAGGVFVDAVTRGGDMIETLQKTRVVFGAATGSVTNMVDDMASKFGSNKGVMLDAASQFGLIGQAAKMSEFQSAKMAVAMTRLADDASSFYNVPLDVALQKIQAGLVGQSRPLREFGVLINIATVNAKAAEMGFKAVHGQFSEGEKVMARMALITEGLNKAQGDHAKTMDTYANQIRQLSGDWENLKTAMGMPLAGATAGILSSARQGSGGSGFFSGFRGALVGAVEEAFFPDEKKMGARMGVDSKEMTAPIIKAMSPMEKFFAERQKYDQFMSDKYMKENAFKGGGVGGPFGMMGNLGLMMANQSMTEDIDKKIALKQREQDQWGGSHVTDPLSFMRDAQERILKPMDETAKAQLDELKAIREVLESKEGSQGGMILRGRES